MQRVRRGKVERSRGRGKGKGRRRWGLEGGPLGVAEGGAPLGVGLRGDQLVVGVQEGSRLVNPVLVA